MIGIDEIKEQQKNELMRLMAWVGSQVRLAHSLGVDRQSVTGWVRRGRISAKAAVDVERLTDGLFKKEKLRPDVITWNGE